MKYYYENQLIRTSDHDYKYALIVKCDGKIYVKKCSSTYKGCEAELNRITKLFRNCQAKGVDYEKALRYIADLRKSYILHEPFECDEKIEEVIKGLWSDQNENPSKYLIVELEAR